MVESFKEVAEYIQSHLVGCKFVGISSDNEVFIELDYDDSNSLLLVEVAKKLAHGE